PDSVRDFSASGGSAAAAVASPPGDSIDGEGAAGMRLSDAVDGDGVIAVRCAPAYIRSPAAVAADTAPSGAYARPVRPARRSGAADAWAAARVSASRNS